MARKEFKKMNLEKLKNYRKLEKEVFNCNKCEQICKDRKIYNYHPPQVGTSINPEVDIMIIATNPGQTHSREQRIKKFEDFHKVYDFQIFYHRNMMKLFSMWKINFKRTLYTNVVKCCTKNNRTLTQEEINNCFPFLAEQFRLIKPKLVICFGTLATFTFLKKFTFMQEVHGKVFKNKKKNCFIIPIYHPSYIFRYKRKNLLESYKKLKFKIKKILEK